MATYTYEYLLHGAKDTSNGYFDGIKLGMNSQITINTVKNANNSKTVNITIPKNTRLFLADNSDYYNNNYCAFIVIKYVVNGTTFQVPSASAINKMIVKDSHRIHHSSPYNYSNCPTADEFKAFSDMVFLFHRGRQISSYGQQINWSHELTSARTITFTLPANAESSYEVYVSGCSMNTTTLCAYFFDRGYGSSALKDYDDGWTIPSYSWVSEATTKEDSNDVGGNACSYCDTNVEAGYITSNPLWEPNGVGGAITITDNGNNTATIVVPKFVIGTGNGISPDTKDTGPRGYQGKYIFIEFLKSDGSSLAIYRRNFPNATSDFSEKFNLPEGTAKISVWAKGVSTYGDNVEKKLLNVLVKYYTLPGAPTKMWINTGKKSQYPDNVKSSYKSSGTSSMAENDAIKPRLKNLLMWKWSGYSGGTNAPVAGFRVFIYKNSTSCLASNSVKVTDLYGIDTTADKTKSLVNIGSAEYGNNSLGDYYDIGVDLVNETDTQFGFIPIDNGFNKKDTCTCKVYTYSYWGDKDSKGNKVKHFSNTALVGSCTIFSSAVIYLKTANGWTEGVPYIKTSSGWKESDGIYIKTDDNTWTEST